MHISVEGTALFFSDHEERVRVTIEGALELSQYGVLTDLISIHIEALYLTVLAKPLSTLLALLVTNCFLIASLILLVRANRAYVPLKKLILLWPKCIVWNCTVGSKSGIQIQHAAAGRARQNCIIAPFGDSVWD